MVEKTPKTQEDFENMSDEEFLKLDEEKFTGNMSEGETDFSEHKVQQEIPNAEETSQEQNADADDQPGTDGSESDESIPDGSTDTDGEEESSKEKTPDAEGKDPLAETGEPSPDEKPEDKQSTPNAEEEGKTPDSEAKGDVDDKSGKDTPSQAGFYKLPKGVSTEQMDSAVEFYSMVSKPFKADGKEITIRTPDEAIRLMQMGMNYNRRMHELKPMKAMHRILEDHKLGQEDLNYMIDLKKGNVDAIKKLIKDNNIDIMDLDVETDSGYQATNYAGDEKTNAFRDAVEGALESTTGRDLITHIHKDWDKQSVAQIRENPTILGNLSAMKEAGVYDRILDEVEHQRTMGYLTNVPFLQAFDQVGEAMKNAGMFDKITQSTGPSMGNLKPQSEKVPVAEGARKDPVQKNTDPNPLVSSTPSSRPVTPPDKSQDFGQMSDEDFLKLAPPP